MTIPQHPTLAWPPIEIEVVGYRIVDAFEAAALKAITTLCEHHPNEVAAYPIGLFPAINVGSAEWLFRTTHFGHLSGDVADETIQAVIRYMNAQYRYQALQQRHMNLSVSQAKTSLKSLGQVHHLIHMPLLKSLIVVLCIHIPNHRLDSLISHISN